ncbi:hypothetical protein DSO57_1004336 [Entomophthora muscae]|uniref:Uncharacterized protein n=1 Tax=Entomophthora muscae TaxID=34485 RepID=A0ACC2SLP6_9FUNG|nr:hypothetical protein DSO57_1004336 [Entomophthora muscae]
MMEISSTSLLPNGPPAQEFSKLEFIYITGLGIANQVVPHTGSWCPMATAVNYIVRITPIAYMAFQAQPDSGMGRGSPLWMTKVEATDKGRVWVKPNWENSCLSGSTGKAPQTIAFWRSPMRAG